MLKAKNTPAVLVGFFQKRRMMPIKSCRILLSSYGLYEVFYRDEFSVKSGSLELPASELSFDLEITKKYHLSTKLDAFFSWALLDLPPCSATFSFPLHTWNYDFFCILVNL